MEKTIICLKWGDAYDSEYVNRMYRAAMRNLSPPFRFVCWTDNPAGLETGIEARDIEQLTFAPELRDIWWKLAVSHPKAGLQGRCLFLDLDVIIVDKLDSFFELPGRFCALRNWISWRKTILRPAPIIFNSSVFCFEAGEWGQVAEMFMRDPNHAKDRKQFSTEQVFMTHAVGAENAEWFPREWVQHYKYDMRPQFPLNWVVKPRIPQGTKIICMTGYPKPHQAVTEGAKGGWHRRMLPMPELRKYWY